MKRTATTETSDLATSTTGVSTTSIAPDPVTTAFLAFWDAYIQMGGTPPPFDANAARARLNALTTGAEKAQLFDYLQKNAATGLVLRGDIEHSSSVASNNGTVAIVRDCMDDRTGVYRLADNSRVDSDDPARHLYTVSLRMEGGKWRVETVSRRSAPCTA